VSASQKPRTKDLSCLFAELVEKYRVIWLRTYKRRNTKTVVC